MGVLNMQLYKTSYENFKKNIHFAVTKPTSISYLGDARTYGDFFQDGQLSLFSTSLTYNFSEPPDKASPSRFQFWTLKNGSWQERSNAFSGEIIGSIHPRKSLLADFNGDTIPDVFVVSHGYDAGTYPGEKNKIVLSSGNGRFLVRDASTDIGFFHSGTAADIDSDGDIDVLAVTGGGGISFFNDGSGNFSKSLISYFPDFTNSKPYYSIELIDVSGDGLPDLFLGGHEWEGAPTVVLVNPGDFNFSKVNPITLPSVKSEGVILDFLVTGRSSEKLIWVLRTSGGDGTFYQSTVLQRVVWPSLDSSVVTNVRSGDWIPWIVGKEDQYRTVVSSDNLQKPFSYAYAVDTSGIAGKAYRIYKAAFDRNPDGSGLGYWIAQMDKGMDLIEVSARFVDSPEFRDLYGTNPTNAQFLTKLYQNVLGRAPEAAGYNWWLNELNTNPSKTKAKVLADFSESAENQTGVASLIGNGIPYEPWVG